MNIKHITLSLDDPDEKIWVDVKTKRGNVSVQVSVDSIALGNDCEVFEYGFTKSVHGGIKIKLLSE